MEGSNNQQFNGHICSWEKNHIFLTVKYGR